MGFQSLEDRQLSFFLAYWSKKRIHNASDFILLHYTLRQDLRELVIYHRRGSLLAKGGGSPLGSKGHLAQTHLTRSQPSLSPLSPLSIEAKGWKPLSWYKQQSRQSFQNSKTKLRSRSQENQGETEYSSNQWHPVILDFSSVSAVFYSWTMFHHGYSHCSGPPNFSSALMAFHPTLIRQFKNLLQKLLNHRGWTLL